MNEVVRTEGNHLLLTLPNSPSMRNVIAQGFEAQVPSIRDTQERSQIEEAIKTLRNPSFGEASGHEARTGR